MIKCEKCQDRGFTEENHGLTVILCDCDKAREVAERNGIPLGLVRIEVLGDRGTESDNRPVGSRDTSQSEKPKKRKAPKKARTRTK